MNITLLAKIIAFFTHQYFRRLTTLIALVSGVPLFLLILEKWYGFPTKEALPYAALYYLLSIILTYIAWILYRLYCIFTGRTSLATLLEDRDIFWEIESHFHCLGRELARESLEIKNNGSYKSSHELKYVAKKPGIREFEIYWECDADVEPKISEEISVSPIYYKPLRRIVNPRNKNYSFGQFAEELRINEVVTVKYDEICDEEKAFTTTNRYPSDLKYEYNFRKIRYPTRVLVIEIEFEENYKVDLIVDKPKPFVWTGDLRIEHHEETLRAIDHFEISKRKAVLSINYPITGMSYGIRWVLEENKGEN